MKIWLQWKTTKSLGFFVEIGRWGFYFCPLNWRWRKYGLSFKDNDDGFSYVIGPITIGREPTGMEVLR